MSNGSQKYMRWGFWPRLGIAFVRIRGNFWTIKAPWNRPLWSERNGRIGIIVAFRGWRLLKQEVGQ